MCVIDSDQPIIMILITIHEDSSCWIHNCTAIYLLITNIKSISSLCSRKCCPSSKERVQAGGGHWVRLDFVSQFVRRPPRCPPGLPPIWLKLSNRVVAAGWDNAKRWWSGQLPVLTLSAPAIRGCALQFSFLLLFFEKLCSWQLPWWPQPLDGSSHKGQLWPEISAGSSITICPHPSFSHSTILKYFAGLSSILDGPTPYLFVSSLVIESRKIRSVTKTIFFLCQF